MDRRNPTSLRIYKVLTSTLNDQASRQAIDTLSSFYPSSQPSHVHTVNLDSDNDDSDSDDGDERPGLGGHKAPTPLPVDPKIAESARTNLRRDVELKLAEGSFQFLQAFAQVDHNLDAIQGSIDSMLTRASTAQAKLNETNAACKFLLDKAGGLQNQRTTTRARQTIITAFLARYTLTDAETDAITSRDVPVGKRLFAAMDRVQAIRGDCYVLLGASDDEDGTRAGLDIMAQTSQILDTAYEKLHRYASYEFRLLGKEDAHHIDAGPILREAVKRLRTRPDLLRSALLTLSQTRQSTLLAAFLAALTTGARPIEVHAHDPVRYVGDMLAWVHQACAGEREFLEGVFFTVEAGRMVGSAWGGANINENEKKSGEGDSEVENKEQEEEEWVRELMDLDLEKICVPLRVRVQQTIKSQEGSITSFRITNLLQFYGQTMQKTIGPGALLSKTLLAITDVAEQVFFDALESQGRSLLRFLHPPDADLAPPLALRDAAQVLREILAVYDASLLHDDEPPVPTSTPQKPTTSAIQGEGDPILVRIFDLTIDPALDMCTRVADLLEREREKEKASAKGGSKNKGKENGGARMDRAVFLINCAVYLQSVLQPFSFAHGRVKELDVLVDGHLRVLVDAQYHILLQQSGLAPILDAMAATSEEIPLSRVESSSNAALVTALASFDTFLSSPLLDPHSLTSSTTKLTTPRLASTSHRRALRKVGEAYRSICGAVRAPGNKYEFASTVLGTKRPFGRMSVLWQILGVEEVEGEDG